jgi:hypothetical protein
LTAIATPRFVTPIPWRRRLLQYGAPDTYRLAAAWLQECATVADWGGASGWFSLFLNGRTSAYTCVDGTEAFEGLTPRVLADLTTYHTPSDGILLRHVLDETPDWRPILVNALAAFRQRLVVVTFTPSVPLTRMAKRGGGWPVWHFNPADLTTLMGDLLVRVEDVPTTHPERVYYLERPR